MDNLSWEELIELGLAIPTDRLLEWSKEQSTLALAKKDRLARRGLSSLFLAEIGVLQDSVRKHTGETGLEDLRSASELRDLDRLRQQALSYWEEVKQIAKIEFGTDPDTLARFRIGVRTGPSILKLAKEFERHLSLLREYPQQLSWLGVDEAFIQKGENLLSMLREAQAKITIACKILPAHFLELCEEKGRLYNLTRKLVRLGRLEFIREPELAASFNYEIVRKDKPALSPARAKSGRASAR
jgi:hypothetical protein